MTDKSNLFYILAGIMLVIGFFVVATMLCAQETEQPAELILSQEEFEYGEFLKYGPQYDQETGKTEVPTSQPTQEQLKVKTWRLPADLHQALVKMVDDFNKEYNTRLEIYKQVLKSSAAEFADMPEDAVFDLQSGVFLSKNDFMMLQERARKLQEQPIKEKASGEIKQEAEDEEKK